MVKVITYGTYDLLHYGHIRLLERAKALGDYLIVGVTADDFDKSRGKINVQQSLMERVESVRATGLADEIIIEEYEGQKIDDIRKYDIDIFTVGTDWLGKFDYLNEFCKVVYLERTEGVSSSEIRSENRSTRIGMVGEGSLFNKFYKECNFVNGLDVVAAYSKDAQMFDCGVSIEDSLESLIDKVDAVYVASAPKLHYQQVKTCLEKKKHVLCETPSMLNVAEYEELLELARENNCIFMDSLKTAYATAYNRLLVLLKSGIIGDVVDVNVTCTSLTKLYGEDWNCVYYWGPTALLPIFNILGTNYKSKNFISKRDNGRTVFAKLDFIYDGAVATMRIGDGVKSEGELIISGTKGYIYVPSPWWKTEYFEARYEDQSRNRRYFYQLDGEGIRYELVSFAKQIQSQKNISYVDEKISKAIYAIMEAYDKGMDITYI